MAKSTGTISAEQIQQWLREGRLDARTTVLREGTTDWRPPGEIPELMAPPHVEAQTDGKAIASLVCGILSVVMLPIIASIPAVILGHMSRAAIRKSLGRLKGEGMALAGLIMGYVSLTLFGLLAIILIIATLTAFPSLRSRQNANESAAIANLRTINVAEVTFLASSGEGKYGSLQQRIDAGLLDERFISTVSGYMFHVYVEGGGYTAEATPTSANTGRYGFYTTRDGVVRYSVKPSLAPSGEAGWPVQ